MPEVPSINFNTLLADVGGTNTRFAVTDGNTLNAIATFDNDQFDNLESLIACYLEQRRERVQAAILGVAGQVSDNQVRLLNRAWHFSSESISDRTGIPFVRLVNDFEAVAYALPHLTGKEVQQFDNQSTSQPSQADEVNISKRTRAVLGSGTGLGVSSVVWTGLRWLALPGEGGHVTLAATTEKEEKFCRHLRERFGHASAERALCGQGLTNIHQFLHHNQILTPKEISARAALGDHEATNTFTMFFELLGGVAGNLALTVGANGGVYVAGGVVQKNFGLLEQDGQLSEMALKFRSRFERKGRYQSFLERVPVYWVTDSIPAFHGLAYLSRLWLDKTSAPSD